MCSTSVSMSVAVLAKKKSVCSFPITTRAKENMSISYDNMISLDVRWTQVADSCWLETRHIRSQLCAPFYQSTPFSRVSRSLASPLCPNNMSRAPSIASSLSSDSTSRVPSLLFSVLTARLVYPHQFSLSWQHLSCTLTSLLFPDSLSRAPLPVYSVPTACLVRPRRFTLSWQRVMCTLTLFCQGTYSCTLTRSLYPDSMSRAPSPVLTVPIR